MAPKKFYGYYFDTKDGPDNRNKKYHIEELTDITLYDGNQPQKLARVEVLRKPWTVKADNPNESWPYYLVDISHDKRKFDKKYLPSHLRNLCFTCKDITGDPSVVEFNEKYPLPADIIMNVTDQPIGVSTFLERIVRDLPDQQPSSQRENQSSAVPDEADQENYNSNDTTLLIANSTAYTGAAKTRPEAFQAISPISASKETSNASLKSFSSIEDDAVNDEELDDKDLPNWLLKPVDFPKKNDIWQVLYDFTLNYLKTFKSKKGFSIQKRNNNYDYIDDIIRLLCTETHYYKSKVVEHPRVLISDDYQIISPEGYTLSKTELREKISPLIEITEEKTVVCKAPVCEGKCAFKKPQKDMTGRRHIINTVLGMTYYCTKCGDPFKGKSNLVDHSNRCPYKQRVAMENSACREDYKEYADQQTKKAKTENPVPIPIIEKLDEKFIDYLKLAHQRLRHSGLISIDKFPEFLDHVKTNFDYNFFVLFRDLVAPKLYGEKLYQLEDTGAYFGIWLCNKLQKISEDPSKSIKFRILSKRDRQYISIHKLSTLRADIINENTKTCWIDGCVCQNTFTTDDAKDLVGHILEKNYLIVCEGCHRGVSDWMFFLEHFTEDCFITRPVKD